MLILEMMVEAGKILAVFPLAATSHQIMFHPILQELAGRGHNVTLITASPDLTATYRQIIVANGYKKNRENINFFDLKKNHRFKNFFTIANMGEEVEHATLSDPVVQRLIHSTDDGFDVVLVEGTFGQEAFVVFGHKFNAPVIEVATMSSSVWLNSLMGNPNPFSYIVDFRTKSTDRMTFMERFTNTIEGVGALIIHNFFLIPTQELIANTYFNYSGYKTRPQLISLLANISLAILNTHVSLHFPHPSLPNLIQVAGLHLQPPKRLPQAVASFLDSASSGAVYFSLGSNVKASMMPVHIRDTFIEVFNNIKFKVLWKWDGDPFPESTSRIKTFKWLPQPDVLAHPNVKVFISHGGFLSIIESVHHGVPMIIIPLFSDQWKNSRQAEAAGFGLTLDFDNITRTSLIWAVNEVITNKQYGEAARKSSKILQDNPMKPLETAVYWIEYVISHKSDLQYMRSAALVLSWYEYFLIDVAVVLIIGLGISLYLLYKTLHLTYICMQSLNLNGIFQTN
uniref:UDP-glucuronosyltransferase n=2 Tax=Clastoptera arizonana TaxID=38151 RepID=A0A1B6CLI6_9HEMI